MRRLSADLAAAENDEPIDLEGFLALRDWLNERRAKRGLPLLETTEDVIPELGIYRRAKALGMVRTRHSGH